MTWDEMTWHDRKWNSEEEREKERNININIFHRAAACCYYYWYSLFLILLSHVMLCHVRAAASLSLLLVTLNLDYHPVYMSFILIVLLFELKNTRLRHPHLLHFRYNQFIQHQSWLRFLLKWTLDFPFQFIFFYTNFQIYNRQKTQNNSY